MSEIKLGDYVQILQSTEELTRNYGYNGNLGRGDIGAVINIDRPGKCIAVDDDEPEYWMPISAVKLIKS